MAGHIVFGAFLQAAESTPQAGTHPQQRSNAVPIVGIHHVLEVGSAGGAAQCPATSVNGCNADGQRKQVQHRH